MCTTRWEDVQSDVGQSTQSASHMAEAKVSSVDPVILVKHGAWECVLQCVPHGNELGLDRQDVDAVAEAVAVEGIADAPAHDDATPSSTNHCALEILLSGLRRENEA